MNKLVIILILTGFLIFLILKFGSKFHTLVFRKIAGNETIESITNKLEAKVLNRLQSDFNTAGHNSFPNEIIFVGLKEERLLQVYAKDHTGIKFIKQYPFTAYNGKLGPKLKEGDKQIPEGIYKIEYLNPNSTYYLSLKINYPNEFDISKTKYAEISEMGSDIFIHGKAATIGCIPIGDEAIEEVFIMAQKAIDKEIKVIISPRDFRVKQDYPNIEAIDWENELYEIITTELMKLTKAN